MQDISEKIIAFIEKEIESTTTWSEHHTQINIKNYVEQLEAKYDGRWIPCSEKLPDVRQDVLVTVKYTGFMGMHGYWIKTGHMEAENGWWGDCAGGEVIAWQPLPQPYQPKGE